MLNVSPTKTVLKALSVRLVTARRGHKLLKYKQDTLLKELAENRASVTELKKNVENRIFQLTKKMTVAIALTSPEIFFENMPIFMENLCLSVKFRTVMNIKAPEFLIDKTETDKLTGDIGSNFLSSFAVEAAYEFPELLKDAVQLAEGEKLCAMLEEEIKKTRRRVNALEYILIPEYSSTIRKISEKLEENERDSAVRLMKSK